VRVSSPEEPAERDVLSSLPRTRPQRRSARRDATGKPARAAAPRKPATTKAKTAAKPRAGAAAKPKSVGAAKATGSAKRKPAPRAKPKAASPPPPRTAAPQGAAVPPPESGAARSVEPPSRTDVLAGAAQAAGDLVQAGLAVGGELLRVALSRLPRP
jgi:hypothetical protein